MSTIARDWTVAHYRARCRLLLLRRALAGAALVTFTAATVLFIAHALARLG
jgi:hypothetical protein